MKNTCPTIRSRFVRRMGRGTGRGKTIAIETALKFSFYFNTMDREKQRAR